MDERGRRRIQGAGQRPGVQGVCRRGESGDKVSTESTELSWSLCAGPRVWDWRYGELQPPDVGGAARHAEVDEDGGLVPHRHAAGGAGGCGREERGADAGELLLRRRGGDYLCAPHGWRRPFAACAASDDTTIRREAGRLELHDGDEPACDPCRKGRRAGDDGRGWRQ